MNETEHKEKVKSAFDRASRGYDNHVTRFFPATAQTLVEKLHLQGDERLLDIAAGTGNVSLRAAEKLPGGAVTALDLSEKMLARAREKAKQQNLTNVSFACLDLDEMHDRLGRFDIVTCSLGLFFLPDIKKSLAGILKTLNPGGRLMLTSFSESLMEPLTGKLLDRFTAYELSYDRMIWKQLDSCEKLKTLLKTSGFEQVTAEARQMGYFLEDVSEWWNLLLNTGYRGLLDRLSPETLERFKKEHCREIAVHQSDDGLWLDVEVLFAEGRKASGQSS